MSTVPPFPKHIEALITLHVEGTLIHITVEQAYDALVECNGSVVDAAYALAISIHRLQSMIDRTASLQSVVDERIIRIADKAEKNILEFLENTEIAAENKLGTSKWALEHLKSGRYARKAIQEQQKSLTDLTPEEREVIRTQILTEMQRRMDQKKVLQFPRKAKTLDNEGKDVDF